MILITGSTGRLGNELIKLFPESFSPSRQELNIIDAEAVFNFININKPQIIIHLAAMTNMDQCEINKELAYKINVGGTENLIDACLKFAPSCYFIYISTPGVFDGEKGNYIETDIPNPKNFYCLTKLLGEFVVKKIENYLIVRGNFVLREKWPYKKAFTDRFGTYLFADDFSQALKEVIGQKLKGVVHIAGEERFSMFDLAKMTTPDIEPTNMQETNPRLPRDMSLKSSRIKSYKITR